MSINFKSLLKSPPCWQRPVPQGDGVVLSTVARVVRNLPGHCFPGWSTAEDRAAVAQKLLPVLRSYPRFRNCHRAEMTELNHGERRILLERRQITPCLAGRQDGCHLLISRDQELAAMVNEEEHLCLHISAPGLDVDKVMNEVIDICQYLESKFYFSYRPKEGFLTSMPREAGEGLQVFAMLHLPALSITGNIDKVRLALEKMHLNLLSFCPEAEESGNLYILFTEAIPNGATIEMVEHFSHICSTLAVKERRLAAVSFDRNDGEDYIDMVYRAYGLLRYARLLDYREMLGAVSLVRLGLQHHLLFSNEHGKNSVGEPESLLRLYALSPAALRHSHPKLADSRQARGMRGDEARDVANSICPVFS